MSTGKGIAIPAPKKPIQAAGTTVFTRDPDGTHHYDGKPGLIEVFKRELRSQAGGGGDPEPEPANSAAKQKAFSAATRLKMAAAQKKRHAEFRKAQEGAGDSGTANPAPTGKRKPKTMTAGSSA